MNPDESNLTLDDVLTLHWARPSEETIDRVIETMNEHAGDECAYGNEDCPGWQGDAEAGFCTKCRADQGLYWELAYDKKYRQLPPRAISDDGEHCKHCGTYLIWGDTPGGVPRQYCLTCAGGEMVDFY